MGIQRPKRLPPTRAKRPHHMTGAAWHEVGPDVSYSVGREARAIVTVRQHCNKLRKLWQRVCQALQIAYTVCQEHADADDKGNCPTVTFDCIGSEQSLGQLLCGASVDTSMGTVYTSALVADWQYAVSASIGRTGGGSGAEKMRGGAKTIPAGHVKPLAPLRERTWHDEELPRDVTVLTDSTHGGYKLTWHGAHVVDNDKCENPLAAIKAAQNQGLVVS